MLTVRETAFDCLMAIIRGREAAPDDRHIAILCELAEAADHTRAVALDRRGRTNVKPHDLKNSVQGGKQGNVG